MTAQWEARRLPKDIMEGMDKFHLEADISNRLTDREGLRWGRNRDTWDGNTANMEALHRLHLHPIPGAMVPLLHRGRCIHKGVDLR